MNYESPRFYEKMRQKGFALPSTSSLARWLQKLDLRPGICEDLMDIIKTKVGSMSKWERKAVILFDEMQIKTCLQYDSVRDQVEGVQDLGHGLRTRYPGTKVLMFMARGVVHRWKMPFAYFIVTDSLQSSTLSEVIRMCVSSVQKAGLEIKSVVCDQSSTNRASAKKMGVSLAKPFFNSNGKKIYWIYDFPHVIKCVRNNMMTIDKNGGYMKLKTDMGIANWSHVVSLYHLDRGSATARATKLTDKHISPNSFEKMSVKLATQVFSHTVSTAMSTAVESKQLPPTAEETAAFLKRINNIFDTMNSKSQFSPNPYKCAISSSTSFHLGKPMKAVRNGIRWVKTWKMYAETAVAATGKNKGGNKTFRRPPSFTGMEHTLRATLLLWKDLREEGASYLLTSRLNQDPLENEFSIARQKCGYSRNPTARVYRQNLRHRLKCALLKPAAGSNCEPDEDDMIEVSYSSDSPNTACKRVKSMDESSSGSSGEDELISSEESDVDLDALIITNTNEGTGNQNSLEACAVRYFAGYAVRSCFKKFDCEACSKELINQQNTAAPDEELISNRRYISPSTGKPCDGLISPSQDTVDAATTTLLIFDKLFLKNIQTVGLRKKILERVKQNLFKNNTEWLKCGSTCYDHRVFILVKLITAKLNCKLQEISKELRQPGGKQGAFHQKIKNLEGV